MGSSSQFASGVTSHGPRLREPKVSVTADSCVHVCLSNGMELEVVAADTVERDVWARALRSVIKTSHARREAVSRESAFKPVSADERVVVEDHKRRILRGSAVLF